MTWKENWEGGRGEYLLKTYCVPWNILLSLFMRRSENRFLSFEVKWSESARYASTWLDTFSSVHIKLFHGKVRNLKLAVSWGSRRKVGDAWIWHCDEKFLASLQVEAQTCLLCCSRQGHYPCFTTALDFSLTKPVAGSMVVCVSIWRSPPPGMCFP